METAAGSCSGAVSSFGLGGTIGHTVLTSIRAPKPAALKSLMFKHRPLTWTPQIGGGVSKEGPTANSYAFCWTSVDGPAEKAPQSAALLVTTPGESAA
eukprot:4595257-Prymnesium_polylepis.1